MVEAEHHQRVGVVEDALVDGLGVAGLVDALEHRNRVTSHLAGQILERQRGAMEQLQRPGDALQEVRRLELGRLVAGPQHVAYLGHGGEAVLHCGRIPLGLPGIAPRPVDAHAAPAVVRARDVILVVRAGRSRCGHGRSFVLGRRDNAAP